MPTYRPTFISHAHADNDLCDRYAAALGARGIDVWYDRTSAQAGHFLGAEIQRELERRSAFVLMMTQQALDSFWVQLELQAYLGLMAQDRSRMLLPVRIGPCAVPPFLNALLWIDALALPFEQAIDAIAAALALRDGATAPSPPSAHVSPQPPVLPAQPGPAPAPRDSAPAHHLTPMSLYTLGFRGYTVGGVECVLPPICPVPGGVFTMGSDKAHDEAADDDESPQYPVHVDDFSIGQHPVIVAEYACAVRAKAVSKPPTFEYQGKRTDWQSQLSRLDHPVVCVSWLDAVAYTRWLAAVTGQPWRLPIEAEWEKMARWDARSGQARRYPWGETFEAARCNTTESGIGTTTPVGRYPAGASPYGAQDVAGNIWEWASSLGKPYPYNQNDGREDQQSTGSRVQRGGTWNNNSTGSRVLRGGSWNNNARLARAACRNHGTRGVLSDHVGFRLALAPVRAGS